MSQETLSTTTKQDHVRSHYLKQGIFMILMALVFITGMYVDEIFGLRPWALIALIPPMWIAWNFYDKYRMEGTFNPQHIVIVLFTIMPFAYIAGAQWGYNVSGLWVVSGLLVGVMFLLKGLKGRDQTQDQ